MINNAIVEDSDPTGRMTLRLATQGGSKLPSSTFPNTKAPASAVTPMDHNIYGGLAYILVVISTVVRVSR